MVDRVKPQFMVYGLVHGSVHGLAHGLVHGLVHGLAHGLVHGLGHLPDTQWYLRFLSEQFNTTQTF